MNKSLFWLELKSCLWYNAVMQNTTAQLAILQQLFSNLAPSQKADFLAWVTTAPAVSVHALASSTENFLSKNRHFSVCPFCGSKHIVKNGHRNGRQRFRCADCGKTFGMTHEDILFKTTKDIGIWTLYINCMIQKMTLRKSAATCGIHLATAFAWRHKILDALTNMMNEVKLDGVVEADETYEHISYKGNHKKSKNFTMPREPHKRGTKATKRGLSKEQVCVTTGVNGGGKSVGRISNLGKPSCKDLGSVLDGHVLGGSIFVTDSHRGYCKLAAAYGVSHIRIPRNHHVSQGFGIQRVNGYHAALKGMINWHFRGVATKYLNNYVVWHNLVNFAKESESEKEGIMRDFVFTTRCESFWKKNVTRPPIPCAA